MYSMNKVLLPVFLVIIYLTDIASTQRGCSDLSNQCYNYERHCNAPSYKKWTKVNCRKTCGFCFKSAGSCRDVIGYEGRCRTYKKHRFCIEPTYKESMSYYCRKTCGMCGAPVNGKWSEWSNWGECNKPCGKGKKIRSRRCNNPAPSLGGKHCSGKNLEPKNCNKGPCRKGCSNVAQWDRTCPYWKKKGSCNKPPPGANKQRRQSYAFMLLNCKKTCDLCSVGVKPSCGTNKGGCMHKCSVQNKKIKCSCNKGYTLRKDKKRCTKRKTAKKPTCGRDKDVLTLGRIVGGVDTVAHRWEWQGGMHYFDEFVCGGSLIAPNLFLTAAHCVQRRTDEREMFIRLGDHNRNKDEKGEQDIRVKKIIIHEDWDVLTLQNDIALLQLEKKAKISDSVGTVCLPKSNRNPKKDSDCYITGWGKTGVFDWEADILQEAKLPIVPNDVCGKRNVDRNKKSRIKSKMICGGYTDPKIKISGCMGDSGGPYVCKDKGKWVLQGVVSWGSNRCDPSHRYTVFTRVSKYIDWINTEKAKLKN